MYGEVDADYTPEGKFYDEVARFRHPQYDAVGGMNGEFRAGFQRNGGEYCN